MAKHRTRIYTDIYLTEKDSKKLKKGYTVLKHYGSIHVAVHRNPHDRKTVRQIEKLKEKIKVLEGRKVKCA